MPQRLTGGCLLVALMVWSASVVTQPAAPQPAVERSVYLDSWVGTWSGSGTQMGMASTEQITYQYEMDGAWLVGRHTIVSTAPDGMAVAITQTSYHHMLPDGSYSGVIFDNLSGLYTYRGNIDPEGALVLIMEMEGAPTSILAEVRITTPDANTLSVWGAYHEPDGDLVETGTMTYTRVP
jgi:hypothetical protein